MPWERLELSNSCEYWLLRPARIPIPPPRPQPSKKFIIEVGVASGRASERRWTRFALRQNSALRPLPYGVPTWLLRLTAAPSSIARGSATWTIASSWCAVPHFAVSSFTFVAGRASRLPAPTTTCIITFIRILLRPSPAPTGSHLSGGRATSSACQNTRPQYT